MIHYVAETGSTNSDLAARLAAGERVPEGDWLVVDRQSAGRGRQGRAWNDGAGNFMGSTVIHPTPHDPPRNTLALLAGVALHEVVGELVPPPAKVQLKWPNDLMVGGAKMAGILLEGTGDAVVLGIGVNLAQAPELPDRETIAMAQFGPAPDRDTFAERLAAQWKADLERWRTYGLAPLVNRWEAAAHPKGTRLAAEIAGEGRIAGTFDGLTEEGAARLRLDNGEVRAIHAGELSYA
ncbi:MAG: biotin--[acetyl-CoA-carboxylase] ligase [Sphingomonadales bacterium CG12_big_fil_rev_8_21_14_0_65_65_10]|uniref:biotin--[biotin carboxyl-carrier protein] ligase n=1 Tax=Blastomonas marina TaxID=1867408 RepID=A0ABQ1F9M4_9SPHN|nr:biotin--[acetyl-CoA-carboxylase] ligase [Blastomonas marina]PIW54745.1 MAG: biotin--[acetyl-CoA-carboxylase] ligase [Sphingomonadales bacterium CG12_big_fil_rev_8_21_14_0_65_65_10]GGA04165.1 putative biotin--acetyl-CoA-carboxylase ligase (BirA bifunctional protein) [Blastomonas marina]